MHFFCVHAECDGVLIFHQTALHFLGNTHFFEEGEENIVIYLCFMKLSEERGNEQDR